MKNIKRIILFLFLPALMLAQDAWMNADLWKLSGTALTPVNTTWTLTLPATTFSPSIITPLIIGGADTVSTLTYKTTTGVGKTGSRHIFQVGTNGGTEAMTILNSGFVGMGTTLPGSKLSIFRAQSNTPGETVLGFDYDGTGSDLYGFRVNTALDLNIDRNYSGWTSVLTVKRINGNVGLGITTPLHKLSGYSTTATNLNAFNFINNTINKVTSTVAQATDTSSFSLNFSSLGSPKLSLKGKTGNSMIHVDSVGVGIGTTLPSSKLSIFRAQSDTPGETVLGFDYNGTGSDLYGFRVNTALDLNIDRNYSGWISVLTVKRVNGNIGFGLTSPTAVLHLKAGTATASTAPLKFTSGTLNTTAEAGAVEFLTDKFYGTITTGAVRKTFAFLEAPSFTGGITVSGNITGNAVTRGADAFTTDATSDTVTISGAEIGDYYTITLTGSAAPTAADAIRLQKTANGFVLWRSASGISGLTYDWFRQK